jgi:hypothetical protein
MPYTDYTVGEAVGKLISGYNGSVEFFNPDPDIIRMPPSDIRVCQLNATLESDGKRLRIGLDITPFLENPDIELTVADPYGNVVASTSIIEPVSWKIILTMHLRQLVTSADNRDSKSFNPGYVLTTVITYPQIGEIDRRSLILKFPT